MIKFLKIAKQKLNLSSEGMYTMNMYTMSDVEYKLLLNFYRNIKRQDAPVWFDFLDGWS